MLFDEITNDKSEKEKTEVCSVKYSYKTPPQKLKLEEEVSKKLSELKSFEQIRFEKSYCKKENCSCKDIRNIFDSFNNSTNIWSPATLEQQIENRNQNRLSVNSIINHINQHSKNNHLNDSALSENNTSNVVKNLITDLNDDMLNTPVLGIKKTFTSSLFKNIQCDSSEKKHFNSTEKKISRNNYYIKEIKSKKYTNKRIKYNKNHLIKSQESYKENKENESNHLNYSSNKKVRKFEFKKRSRKSGDQIKQLNEIYKTCTEWNKNKISEIAKSTGLSENQVYKWIWDQKRKSRKSNSKGLKI